jgi:hypothetical protein
MKRAADKVDDKQCCEHTKKRDIKSCISCGGVASFQFNFCPKGCHYHVCIECTFGFSDFVNGSTFDNLRIKCMVCREALPTHDIEHILRRMLARRRKFYVVLKDRITEDRIILAKDDGDILIGKTTGYINRYSMPIYQQQVSLPQFIPGFNIQASLASLLSIHGEGGAIILPPVPPYTPTRPNRTADPQ